MRTGQTHLFNPGPARVPAQGPRLATVAQGDLMPGLVRDLRPVFGTTEAEMLFQPGTATAAWETATSNTLSPGDKVLVACHGQFSTLWGDLAAMLGLDPVVVHAPWGAAAPVDQIDRLLGADVQGEIKAVFVTHCETSTGVVSDLAAVRRALDSSFHEALLFVDGSSSIGSMPFAMDAWGVDIAVTGSRKGMMMPAGLALLAVGPRALDAAMTARMRRAYHDFNDMRAPGAVPADLLSGLRVALDRLHAEGLHAVHTRHRRLAEGLRRGVEALGLSLVAEWRTTCSDTVTAVRVPEGVDAREVLRIAEDDYNAAFGAGLGPLAGKAFRIGHLGDINEGMVLTALSLAELALMRAGARVVPGAGVGAAQAWFASGIPSRVLAAE
ncbi:pyridoxal-phosphate-dependent aminotransferase family protein [Maliponia aquimaris]|uniref:Soluble hydrogenase 42 kDa subunit n=1 Tax=Maliponia aquimaris TaxID=1673631 RepID=A0A238KK50_9RHOB|nr:aminotransferase class V-fold PLP-dependent enzyme [Maliponia aquimaris]SMX43037.1 Soluble hydrogenase 42 kDa subunit [Maliponia aquimaris]